MFGRVSRAAAIEFEVESGGIEPPCCNAFCGAYYANILHLFRFAAEGNLANQSGSLCSRLPSAFPFPKAQPLFSPYTLAVSECLEVTLQERDDVAACWQFWFPYEFKSLAWFLLAHHTSVFIQSMPNRPHINLSCE